MLFSEFINHTLAGNNGINWDYYHSDIDSDSLFCANNASSFIRQYFENGEKHLPLILSPDEAADFLNNYFIAGRKERVLSFDFDRKYQLPDFRATHTVSGFFLGLLIENCINADYSLSLDIPQCFPFSYLWFLTYLYHDYGYCVTEREDSPIPVPTHAPIPYISYSNPYIKSNSVEYSTIRNVRQALGVTLSPFSPYMQRYSAIPNMTDQSISLERALLRELTQKSYTVSGNRLRFNNGAVINRHQYTSATVTRYFNYCINERKRVDHGIVGGFLFYDRIIKNYLAAYLSASSNATSFLNLGDFYFRGRHFSENQLPVFSYISDCIIAHNIWKAPVLLRGKYKEYLLDKALDEEYVPISYNSNPLLYILVVADTLEPTKIYEGIPPQIVSESINIDYSPGSRKLTFSTDDNILDIGILYEKAKDLESWTDVCCTELRDGAFSVCI